MRIFEIVNPADQLALWKLISTSVWQSIEQQVRDQQRQLASQAIKKKRPKLKGSTKGRARLPRPLPPNSQAPKTLPSLKKAKPTNQPQQAAPPPQQIQAPNPTLAARPGQAPALPTQSKPTVTAQLNPLKRVKSAGF